MWPPLMLLVEVMLSLKVGQLLGEPPGLYVPSYSIEAGILKMELLINGAALGNELALLLIVSLVVLDFSICSGVVEASGSLGKGVEQAA
jgi:hypothetical protein